MSVPLWAIITLSTIGGIILAALSVTGICMMSWMCSGCQGRFWRDWCSNYTNRCVWVRPKLIADSDSGSDSDEGSDTEYDFGDIAMRSLV